MVHLVYGNHWSGEFGILELSGNKTFVREKGACALLDCCVLRLTLHKFMEDVAEMSGKLTMSEKWQKLDLSQYLGQTVV